jgi:Na+/H+-dicarboxylate symporter/ABC-type amino acid transport substrate-binding protein
VFLGLVLGIATGIFLGDLAAPLQTLGAIFIGLLQMTVLPYILVSLIAAFGRLSLDQVKNLALQGGALVAVFWAIILALVALVSLGYPSWESASFFSTSLLQAPPDLDPVALYIPANPFSSLSEGVIPAIVLFCVALGLALIQVDSKGRLLDLLDTANEALMAIAQFVARLAPIGVFALVASAAGTLDADDLGRLQVYLATYIVLALLLTFWVLPGLVASLTPLRYRDTLSHTKDALITAFATGSLLIVLPIIADETKRILHRAGLEGDTSSSPVDVVVPINFNLPNLGKLLALSFVPFAGWFAGTPVPLSEYPLFLLSGLLSFFGEVVFALPFLMDLMQVPADMFQLFLAVDVFAGRFGTLVAGVHTIALALLVSFAVAGGLRVRWSRLAGFAGATLVLALVSLGAVNLFFTEVVPSKYNKDEFVASMQLLENPLEDAEVYSSYTETAPDLPPLAQGESRLERAVGRGVLRVGYRENALPQSFLNASGQLVGFDIELAHHLARDLELGLELVPIDPSSVGADLSRGRFDLVVSGEAVTPQQTREVAFTEPYQTGSMALLVNDSRREQFGDLDRIRGLQGLRVGVPARLPYYSNKLQELLPNAETVPLEKAEDFFYAPERDIDAMLTTAEIGSAWSLLYPEYSVVIPKPVVSVPIAMTAAKGDRQMVDFLNTWLRLKQDDGTLDAAYRYWILGQGDETKRQRWSVIRDVLHWVD